jgi:hypothetical protein
VISTDELMLLRRSSELADRVIRVDDFAQDLGAAEFKPPVAATPATAAGRKIAAA